MSTYSWINLLSISIPFIASFHPRLAFYKKWYALFPALIITALIFIAWDIYFTSLGIWGFSEEHIGGLNILNLPVEEMLFFLTIPYAIVFTYDTLRELNFPKISESISQKIFLVLSIVLIIMGFLFRENLYTSTTFFSTAVFLLLHIYLFKSDYLGNFIPAYIITFLFPFIIVNGALTGLFHDIPVVWYNDAENLGVRVLTIPVEDFIYGMLLYLMNITIFEYLTKKS